MKLERRLDRLGRKVKELEIRVSDGRSYGLTERQIIRALTRGDFDTGHLDAVFRLIRQPMKASLVWAGASVLMGALERLREFDRKQSPLLCAAILIACDKDQLEEEVASTFDWVLDTQDAPTTPRNVHRTTYHKQRLYGCLIQRLFQTEGYSNLMSMVANLDTTEDAMALVPVLSDTTCQRLALMSAAFEAKHDIPLMLWSDQQGQLWTSWREHEVDKSRREWTSRIQYLREADLANYAALRAGTNSPVKSDWEADSDWGDVVENIMDLPDYDPDDTADYRGEMGGEV